MPYQMPGSHFSRQTDKQTQRKHTQTGSTAGRGTLKGMHNVKEASRTDCQAFMLADRHADKHTDTDTHRDIQT